MWAMVREECGDDGRGVGYGMGFRTVMVMKTNSRYPMREGLHSAPCP